MLNSPSFYFAVPSSPTRACPCTCSAVHVLRAFLMLTIVGTIAGQGSPKTVNTQSSSLVVKDGSFVPALFFNPVFVEAPFETADDSALL